MKSLRYIGILTINGILALAFTQRAWAVAGGEYLDSSSLVARSTVGLVSYNEGDTVGEWCTGSIVAPHFILTAAHCLSSELKITKIMFSVDLSDSSGVAVFASQRIPHPKFKGRKGDGWDIGLVRFEEELPNGFQMIAIPDRKTYRQLVNINSTYFLAGYGDHSTFDTSSEFRLKSASLQFMQYNEARNEIEFFQKTSGALCSGDSGGPLIVYVDELPFLVGVASLSHGGNTLPESCGDTSTFTALGNKEVRNWIESVSSR